ncbi:hypothetical protein ACFC09_34770 [Streptomyces sp. NPDC056161]|uniref:hypothetical protein n=1 Tax=Streptomyces sp. NPDC056161 TaxID=3345732 RepID=UPI0035D9AC0B
MGGAAEAGLNFPHAVAADDAGNIYIADDDNHRVRKVTPHGVITTVAGCGRGEYSGDGEPAAECGCRQ